MASNIEQTALSRMLRVSSVHSVIQSDTETDFSVNLSKMSETNNIVRIVLKSVDFPNNFYNITSLNNSFTLEFSTDGVISITPITPGFYTLSELITILETDINGQLGGGKTITITQQQYTDKLTFTPSSGTVKLYNKADAPSPSNLSPNLGIETTTGFASSQTSDKIPNLYGITKVYIHSLDLSENNLVDGDVEKHDILGEVPVTVPYGQWNYYESRDDELDSINYPTSRNLNNVRIQVKDLEGNILTLNGGNLTLNLKLYYIP